MTERYIIRRKTDNKYYRSARARHLWDNWVDDMQLATVLYSNSTYNRFTGESVYERVFVKLKEQK